MVLSWTNNPLNLVIYNCYKSAMEITFLLTIQPPLEDALIFVCDSEMDRLFTY